MRPRFVLPWLPVSAAEGFPRGCGSPQHNSISWHKYKRWGLPDWYCDSAASVPNIYILVFDGFCTCKGWCVFGRVSFRSPLAECGHLFMWCIGEASGKPLQGVRYKTSFFPQLAIWSPLRIGGFIFGIPLKGGSLLTSLCRLCLYDKAWDLQVDCVDLLNYVFDCLDVFGTKVVILTWVSKSFSLCVRHMHVAS